MTFVLAPQCRALGRYVAPAQLAKGAGWHEPQRSPVLAADRVAVLDYLFAGETRNEASFVDKARKLYRHGWFTEHADHSVASSALREPRQ